MCYHRPMTPTRRRSCKPAKAPCSRERGKATRAGVIAGHERFTLRPVRFNPSRIHDQLRAAHGRLSRVGIEQLPWQDCIRRYDRPHTLFYCDPPYWETAGYGPAFQFSEYQELARMMAALRGRAILSINDHPAIRDCFKGFYMEDLSIRYSPGGGAGKEARELLIFSYAPSS